MLPCLTSRHLRCYADYFGEDHAASNFYSGSSYEAKLKSSPLEFSGQRIVPSVTHVFTTKQELYVFFQAYAPENTDSAKMRAGLVFFRDGQKVTETPLVEPAEIDAKNRTASFRINLPFDKFVAGGYTVQAVVVDDGGDLAAFARNNFALLPPTP